MSFVGWFFYRASQVITSALAYGLWNIKYVGRDKIPATGAFLLCPVHRSNIDGPLTCTFTSRRMRYLAKETMFDIEWLGNVYRSMGAIKVNRGVPDRSSLNECMKAVESGYPLVLFPEGTRKEGPLIEEVNEGAAYLALRANIPIVPVGISGSEDGHPKGAKFIRPAKVTILIGDPIYLDRGESTRAVSRSAITDGTALITKRLQELYDEAKAYPRS